MNTFLPYESFEKSARVLDYRRLGKQRVECLQMLRCLENGPKTPWYFHPCTQMYKDFEGVLASYGIYICDEWIKRGYKDNCRPQLIDYLKKYNKNIAQPPFIGNKDFHLAMQSNLIRKNEKYYRPIFGNDVPNDLPYIWEVPEKQ